MNPCRIAHLNFIDEPGVTRKLREEAKAAKELGLPIDFYLVSSNFEDHDEDLLHFRKRRSPPLRGKLRLVSELFMREDLIGDYVDIRSYDMFVVRFTKLFLGQGITYRRHGKRIVTEHHTDEIAEIRLKPGLARKALAVLSLRRSKRALRRVAGLVAMTDEVLRIEEKKCGFSKPALVLPNGVSVPEDSPPNRTLLADEAIQIVFAAANFQPWQGLDRLLEGLLRYDGHRKLALHIAGNLDSDQIKTVKEFTSSGTVSIHAHGLLEAEALGRLYDACHVGIAGLAFDRIRTIEACPLKVREYTARGLPFVHTHVDPDFPQGFSYALKLAQDGGPADIGSIVRFVETVYGGASPTRAIWEFARDNLDWNAKLKRLHGFAAGLPTEEAALR